MTNIGTNTYISPTATLKGKNIKIGDGCLYRG